MFASKDLLFSAEKYGVAKSLRFRASASAYLNRTLASNSTSSTTLTWSMWVKRGLLSSANRFLLAYNGNSAGNGNMVVVEFFQDNIRCFFDGAATNSIVTSQVFRDPSAWYHIVFAYDTTQATASNRAKLYVNGAQVTAFSTANYPALNQAINAAATNVQYIGVLSANYFDGYMAEVNFIDGQALTPSSFGFYDNFGVWQPKGYTGAYGTNGFYLNFSDNSAATAAAIGKDYSGNGNNFTPNNISVTAGVTYDSMIDSPTNYTDGGNGRGNYCVLNPISPLTTATLAAGNLQFTSATAGHNAIGSIGMSDGKWYWEAETSAGTTQARATVYGTSAAAYYSFAANSTVYGFRFDAAAGTFEQTANGSTWTSIATGLTSGPYFPYFNNNGTTSKTIAVNFGQRPFSYTPPSDFLPLNTNNLTTPTITNGAQYMAAVLYTGTGSSQTITTSSTNSGNNPNGTTFQPDFVWVKGRSGATDHALYDAVRGVQLQLESNTTTAETTETTGLTAFTSSGFTTGALAQMNTNTATYVAWEWLANGTGVINNDGSIPSTVSANKSAGFSIVTWAGNTTANSTVGHGLGAKVDFAIVRNRNTAGNNWVVWHSSVTSGNGKYLYLNLNNAIGGPAGTPVWDSSNTSTQSSTTTFTIGANSIVNSGNMLMYCFASVAGYSDFGSYTGNGSANGPFIYTGFRPRWVLIKCSSAAATNWELIDTSRDTYNLMAARLIPNLNSAESTTGTGWPGIDFVSNGFKIRTTNGNYNTSAATYVYAAFAENPFKISRAR